MIGHVAGTVLLKGQKFSWFEFVHHEAGMK